MSVTSPAAAPVVPNPWPLVLCLVGLDYFSTLAYLPSIAVEAAGPLAPLAAGGVVLVTFLLAVPVYWYVIGRAPDGRGAAGMLEESIPGWRGKLVVLTVLGFAAADFVITRSLSLADAAIHLIRNPHGQVVFARLPRSVVDGDHLLWPPLENFLRRFFEPQVAVALCLSIISALIWQWLKRDLTRRMLLVAAGAVSCYLALTALIIVSAFAYTASHPAIWNGWLEAIFGVRVPDNARQAPPQDFWLWSWLGILAWSFPQMALGLSGFEMIKTMVPFVSGGRGQEEGTPAGRVRNTRKMMIVAATIMAVYLISAVTITTLLVPRHELMAGGAAQHRALAYLAHGSPLANGLDGAALNPIFGHRFGDLYDLASIFILCLAGACVTMGLQNVLPLYLHRLGMEISWAGRISVILNVLGAMILVVTVMFRASPSSQQWAYATSVLILLAAAALATSKDISNFSIRGRKRLLLIALSTMAGGFFLAMTGITVLINPSGLSIAATFVAAIVVSSFVSRWIRSTELRFEGFDFADEATRRRWSELCKSGSTVLAPHRPGLVSLTEKNQILRKDHRLDPATQLIFIEAELGDPSNFYQKPQMKFEYEGNLEVIRVSRCVSVSHVLAAICLELCQTGGALPEIIFGWSIEPPLAANLNFLLLGEGNIPWMVKELVRKAMPDVSRQPRIRIG